MALFDLLNEDDGIIGHVFDELSANTRRKSATIKPSKDHPSGRFPMPDKKHARLALQDLPKAKGMSKSAKAKVKARANRMLGKGKK